MNVLEKILEEIENHAIEFESFGMCDDYVSVGWIKEIIRSHMLENDGWIPVEERLPEETTGKYYPEMIVTTSYGAVTWGFYRVMDKQWYIYSNIHNEFVKAGDKEIVAWRPLPEPYKPSKDIPATEHIMSRFMKVE